MRRLLWSVMVLASCIAFAGCSSVDTQYLREGVGSDVYYADVTKQTSLQELYVQHVCEQAGLGTAGACDPGVSGSTGWTMFVQAGMNDVDQRCDAYLVWLDARRRSQGPVLQEISDVRTATAAILVATGAGVEPLAIAAATFGLATSSFTNLEGSLVFALDQSTVQSVVLSNQSRFRASLPKRIDNRSAALFALRSYMRLCMPMTIDTQVNTTVRLFEQGDRLNVGAVSDAKDHPLISGSAVRTAILADARSPLPPRPSPVPAQPKPVPAPPKPVPRSPDAQPVDLDAEPVGPYEQQLVSSPTDLRAIEAKLCIRSADDRFTVRIRNTILSFLKTHNKDQHYPDRITDKDAIMIRSGLKTPNC